METKQEPPRRDRRAYRAEWRKNNPESIRESNRKYYEKLKARRADLVSDYTKSLSKEFPGFILMCYRGNPLLCSVFPNGMEMTITGIAEGELATIKVAVNGEVTDTIGRIPHDKLFKTVDWEKVRLAWM